MRAIGRGRLRLCIMASLSVASMSLVASGYALPQEAVAAQDSALTPSNQAALDAAADDARTVAGSSYFTDVAVDTGANIVSVYLADAPQDILDKLQAEHPGTYIFYPAAHPRSALLDLQSSISAQIASLAASGIDVSYLQPTADGHLEIGVTTDITAATSQLDAAYGKDWVRVVQDNEPAIPATFRYDDVSPWNGGDFIYHRESSTNFEDCSSGIPLHDTSTGTNFMLTAAHCFWSFGGVGTNVRNGFVKANGDVYAPSSTTLIGSVTKSNDVSAGTTSLDSALIKVSTSVVDFNCAWDCAGRAIQIGTATNNVGDQVCTSGAFDGQVCGIVIRNTDQTRCITESWGTFCVDHLVAASPDNSSKVAAGQGDSGGPVYSYSGSDLLARGMIDQIADLVSCTSVPTGTSNRLCGNKVFFVALGPLDSHWGTAPNT